jgi:hypothetical protein
MSDRDRDHENSMSSQVDNSSSTIVCDAAASSSAMPPVESIGAQHDIDLLFGTPQRARIWEPARPPLALGELLDSRYMLRLLFPSDPRMLAAVAIDRVSGDDKLRSARILPDVRATDSNIGNRTMLQWRLRNRKIREVGVEALQWVDGNRTTAHWAESFELPLEDLDDQDKPPPYTSDDHADVDRPGISQSHSTPLTRKPSTRSRGRASLGTAAPIDP